MSRKGEVYGAFHAPHYDFVRITFWAVGYAFVTYVASGMFPFAVWAARGFDAAHAKSLFIPWVVLLFALYFVAAAETLILCHQN
jgi:hypothetical protein